MAIRLPVEGAIVYTVVLPSSWAGKQRGMTAHHGVRSRGWDILRCGLELGLGLGLEIEAGMDGIRLL